MEKREIYVSLLSSILMFSIMAFAVPQVSATPQHRIVLPFHTSWENQQPLGRINSVDYKKDFYGYYGTDNPPPELGYRDSGDMGVTTPPDGTFFYYKFGSRYLMAAGYFGSSDSYCYFNLFDTTPDSDFGPPIKIKPYTFINIWYRHKNLAHCMIDAQIYNSETHQYWTLRNFYKYVHIDGSGICVYIKDQNGVRMHPGYRYNDAVDSWQFASFDLSIVYEANPNWYITKIWIGFDNTIDPNHPTGQARTYFDMLYISYGVGNRQTTTQDEPGYYYNAWTTGSIVAWHHDLLQNGYSLWLKVAISAFNDGYVKDDAGNPLYFIRPYKLRVSTAHSSAQFLNDPKPTGLNLTQPAPELPPAAEFVLDVAAVIVSLKYAEVGYVLSACELASEFLGLLKTPTGKTYEWPRGVGWYTYNLPYYALPHFIQGEVYILISGLSAGVHPIPITFEADYCYADYDPSSGIFPVPFMTESFTFNIEWTNTPDDVDLPPDMPSTPKGRTSGYTGTTYPYSTNTTDPEGGIVRYEFWWGDSTTTTTDWHNSGETATASHYWTSPGTYNVRVRAQDYDGYLNGYWSALSPILTVNIVNGPPNVPSVPLGSTSGYVGGSYTYSTSTTDFDGDDVRYEFNWGDGTPNTITGWYSSGATANASHSWSSPGTYYVKVRAQDVYNQYSNWSQPLTVSITLPSHDVSVIEVTPTVTPKNYPNVVMELYEAYPTWLVPFEIKVTVKNEGGFTETFNITAYSNTTPIGTQTVTNLAPEAETTLPFTWDVPDILKVYPYPTYTFSAKASVVPGETNTNNNRLVDGTVTVKWPGDANGDGHVNFLDLSLLSGHWFSIPTYDPRVDFNMDGNIDSLDLSILSQNWFKGPLD